MIVDLKGKRIIITGAARGIGGASADVLVAEGANVCIFDIRDEEGKKLAADLTKSGPGWAKYIHVDVSKRAEVFSAVDAAAKELGGIDCLVNNAGVALRTPIEDIKEEEWDWVHDIHLKGTLFCCQAAFPHLKAAGGGSIINFGSDAGIVGVPMTGAYGPAKGAILAFSRTACQEWGKHWIRVNSINPAVTSEMDQEFRKSLSSEDAEKHAAMLRQVCPLGGKMGDPKRDVAPVVAFLASDASRFISGQLLCVNGGMTAVR